MPAQTSDAVSTIASRYITITDADLLDILQQGDVNALAVDIRTMAASLLRQDETKGQRGA